MSSGFSKFNIEDLGIGAEADQRGVLKNMARVAEACERYEDMCDFMKRLVTYCCSQKEELQDEERNLLSVAYKNVIGARRASWRTLSADADAASDSDPNKELLEKYKMEVEAELQKTCNEVLNLLEASLLENCGDKGEARVFYLKMIGDYYRYLAESTEGDEPGQNAAKFYKEAYTVAENNLAPTHPIRLGLALNFSVCHYEILKNKQEACDMAKKAFDAAISKLDQLEETDYKDSTLIMQLLRDNLTLWTNDSGADDQDGDE